MATLVLSAAGAAIGGSLGGTVLGLSSVVAGRFVGAVVGRALDQRIMGQGSDPVETGRVDRLRFMGAGEGDPVARVHGRIRVAGQVIWATQFEEVVTTSGGGKGAPRQPVRRDYSYRVSVAIALCEGEISGVGRIWADGTEIASADLSLRVYTGSDAQLPDPKMEAVEGAVAVPAYRGTAYVVIEDLDLSAYGNRLPQFGFEVIRPAPADIAPDDPARAIRAVAMMPGSGEYALAVTPVTFDHGAGRVEAANVSSPSGQADFPTALDQMEASLPGCDHVSLIVSWFGDDLRCGACTIRPGVELRDRDGAAMPWTVSGVPRAAAMQIAQKDGRPIYGGTPCDVSVIEALREMAGRGQKVMYYPFILMLQGAGNDLPDPYGGDDGQPVLPWRGRITASLAHGVAGSPDGTAATTAEVAAFFGTVSATDFTVGPGTVSYTGPAEWTYRRFVLHQAALCAAAGGVDAFCIGSEMVGLTRIRDDQGFPAVAQLIALAAEVRALLPEAKIGYAADWTEYSGYQRDGDLYFPLDPLWADPNIDFVGIDNYLPLSDWREGEDHADAHWGAVHDLGYLKANIEGGELYDWYYHSDAARAAQIRTPITDGEGEPWVWRVKDIRNWWQNRHYERIGGVRALEPTAWEAQSKPVWFTELGCAAIDKGTNQPNKFLDPKSSESALPYFSTGRRDDVIAMQYLRAMLSYWGDPAMNPVSAVYDAPMIDMDRAHVWAWDARPFPWFPNARDQWGDGENYARGHWITGRASARSLAGVVAEICARAGVAAYDVSGLHGVVWGYEEPQGTGRAALQPLMLRYGFDAVDREGVLQFVMRDGRVDAVVDAGSVCITPETEGAVEEHRASEAEMAGRVRLRFIEAEANFETIAEEAVLPREDSNVVAAQELPLVLLRGEGRQVVERWLAEASAARDTLRCVLPPSRMDLGAGDVVRITGTSDLYRVDRIERGAGQLIEAVRIEAEAYRPVDLVEAKARVEAFVPPVPVFPLFLDLPLMRGDEVPHAPHVAVTAQPWPGTVAVYSGDLDADYALDQVIDRRAVIGVTQAPLSAAPMGRIDRGEPLALRLTSGSLTSVTEAALLAGRNLMAIGDGTPEGWELLQFRDAVPAGDGVWLISHRLRGQLGTDATMPAVWPAGSYVVLMDGAPTQLGLTAAQRGLARHYRIGPARRDYADGSYRHAVHAFPGLGLRPLSPVHLRVTPEGDDLHLRWIRRSRIAADSWDGIDIPLGEEAERYLLRIMEGTALRREVMLDTPGWTYTAAQQAEDGGAPGLRVEVAQISALYGAGGWTRQWL
ncbi:baseplate multidomain protein megatron [Pseudooceanicola onchidii]|uniref:baseplate multidomain protein megatron n=1 Tax=Pseudooceanicola onchidii TaxID=2562279 RepID=UPI0010AB2133|nr:glycoside hydrolase/phage tail family protein [Pseudooceanicola onchidii]